MSALKAARPPRVLVSAPRREAGIGAALRDAFTPSDRLPADLSRYLDQLR